VVVIGAADPAQPYGAALPWPRREGAARSPSRTFGAQVVLLDGAPVLYAERGGRRLVALREIDPAWAAPALRALVEWAGTDRARRLRIERADGAAVFEHPLAPLMREAGFREGLRALEAGG
jgi:ATP-dependent Lhr-like helicase